jgi:hypothetical protein
MKKFLTFKKVNPLSEFDIDFTYKILVNKYKATNIVIGDTKCPTLEEHKKFLSNNSYLCYYIVYYKETAFFIVYVDDEDFLGAFLDNESLRDILKKYKNDDFFKMLKEKNKTLSQGIFKEFLEMEPNIKHLNSRINPLNVISYVATVKIGFEPNGNILTFNR